MAFDSRPCQTFDVETLRPLDPRDVAEIESACTVFNEQFNSVFAKEYRYEWNASPLNLGNLDYDFYEFGGGHWYQDQGYGFTCAWGQILTTSFGFQWMKMEGATSLRDWVLKHGDASYVFFPWQTLWSIVESCGNQSEKAVGAWMRILNQVDSAYVIPTGWHIIPDVLQGDINWVPKRVASEMRKIYDHPSWCYETLGLWPYYWHRKANWNEVQQYIESTRVGLDSM